MEDACRQVLAILRLGQVFAAVATSHIGPAAEGDVADARGGPKVVHGPDDGFATAEYLSYRGQREHALVDPFQLDDISLSKCR